MTKKEKDEIQLNLVDQLAKLAQIQKSLLTILHKLENEEDAK